MDIILDMLFAQAIRFYLFDFYVFRGIRDKVKAYGGKRKKLLECPFCHGFHVGWIYYLIKYGYGDIFAVVQFGFVTAFVAFMWRVFSYRPLKDMDNEEGK